MKQSVRNLVYTDLDAVPFRTAFRRHSMKRIHLPLVLFATLFCTQGFAATAQQNKMTTCNADATAKSLKGDDRKAYMSSCLKATPAGTPQQEKMKSCNATASTQSLTGDARKSFMSTCLKKS